MGVLWSCCECPEGQAENNQLCAVMPRQDPVPNYLSVSYDSMALLPPLGRPVRRGVPSLRQPSEESSPSLSHSLVRPEQSGASSLCESHSSVRTGKSGASSPCGTHSPVGSEQALRSPQ
ncbi:hypothetical protein MRX96_033078 [Rhipicephalus microplus]